MLSVDGDALEQSGAQTLKRRLAKIVGGSCTEAEALPRLLAALPPSTVCAALPDVVVDTITDTAQCAALKEIQDGLDTLSCMNIKSSLKLGKRPWNRMRNILGFKYNEGKWQRKTVGRTGLPVPILPESRNLAAAAKEIADSFGCELGGAQDGTSAHADFNKCLNDDIEYCVKQGKLVVTEQGSVELPDGRSLIVQVKMDACRLWSKVQQTSLGYVLVNACENPNSPFDTTEVTLFEGDDHWESVRKSAPETLRDINQIARHNIINIQGLMDAQGPGGTPMWRSNSTRAAIYQIRCNGARTNKQTNKQTNKHTLHWEQPSIRQQPMHTQTLPHTHSHTLVHERAHTHLFLCVLVRYAVHRWLQLLSPLPPV